MKIVLNNVASKCFVLTVALSVFSAGTVRPYATASKTHGRFSGNLAECLRYVAREYQVPIIAELVYPLPRITFPAGEHTAIELLNKLRAKAPAYAYEIGEGNVIHFYSKTIRAIRGNLWNIPLQEFTMPPNVSELKITLPALINNARHGLDGMGIVISSFPSADLEKEKLKQVRLRDVTGRQVLMKAAKESGSFYTIIVFPSNNPHSQSDFNYANQHWFWGALTEKDSNPIYIQPPPKRAAN